MPRYCDVAVPVPLDATFTYLIPENAPEPPVGGRVIVPFREKRLCGIVTELHDREPKFQTRRLSQVLDTDPSARLRTDATRALDRAVLHRAHWRSLSHHAAFGAEFRRVLGYRITDKGIEALHAASTAGSSLRSRKEPEHQMLEYAVLNRLGDGEVVREGTLRSAAGASRAVLQTLLRKKWIASEDLSDIRDASRTVQIATLKEAEGKLNKNQQTIIAYLRGQENHRAPIEDLRRSMFLARLCRRWCVEASLR